MARRLARIAALACAIVVGSLLSPLSGQADPPPTEMQYVCAQKSSGTLRYVTNATSCLKTEKLVTVKPGPVIICVQPPTGPTKFVSSVNQCKKPATAVTLPPASGLVYFCVNTSTGAVRYVTGPDQCTASEFQVQVGPNDAAPTVASTSPVAGSVSASNIDIALTFSESVNAPASAFAITCGGVPQAFALSGLPGTTATLDPDADLPMGTSCTVATTANLVTDTDALDPPDTMAANHSFSFSVDAAPAFVSSVPATGATGVAVGQAFVVTFSEPVHAAAGAFNFVCNSGAFMTGGDVTGDPGTALTVTPSTDLPATATCELDVTPTLVSDVDATDPPDTMTTGASVTFTTADAAPAVVSTVPLDVAGSVATDTNVSVTWSESVTVAVTGVSVDCGAGAVAGVLSGSPGATTTFDPTSNLPEGALCTVHVEADDVTDVDAVDPPDHPAADHDFTFTTDSAPTLDSSTPADGASDIDPAADIVLGFSEPVTAAAAAFTLTCDATVHSVSVAGSGTDTLTLTPTGVPETASCSLVVTGSGIHDADSFDPPDTMVGTATIDYTTTDAAPSVSSTVPADNATQVATDANVSVTWSESVTAAATAISVDCGAGSVAGVLSGSPGATTTFNPTAALPEGATCAVHVEADDVTDVDGVDPPDHPAADHDFSFTTDVAPTLESSTPADGAVDVDPSADIVLGFSEPVTAAAAAFTLTCNASPYAVTVAGSGTDTLTLTPVGAPGTSTCSLSIDGALVHDVDAGDPPDTVVGTPVIGWTTADAAPSVTSTSPVDGATGVAPSANITVTFSEAVDVTSAGFTLACPTGNTAIPVTVTEGAGNVWTLDPDISLPQSEICTVTVVAAEVTDDDTVDPPDQMAADYSFSFTILSNLAPTDVALAPATVAENLPGDSNVGTLTTTDPDVGDTFTYTLVTGTGDTDNALFAIDGTFLHTASPIDFEAGATRTVRIRTTDAAGAFYEEAFTITITNVNEAPTDIGLDNTSVAENQASGTTVGTLSRTDQDAGDSATYTLVAGTGSTDNGSFSITGTTLKTAAMFNFEVKASYSVRVRVTDGGGLFYEEPFTITVVDANDAPVAVTDSYSGAIGNTLAVVATTGTGPHKVLTGNVIVGNDTDEDVTFPHTLTAVAGTVASTGGGTATIATDGSFTFLPGVGDKNQTDSFTYQVTDGTATTPGTVQVGIGTDLVWYVDSASVTATHDGRSASPLLSFVGLNGAGGAGDSDLAGETIFVYTGTGSYAGGLVLEGTQQLLGQPNGLVVGATTLVAAGGTNPVITNAAGVGLTLASGVSVQGVTINAASTDGIQGTSVATASVGTATAVTVSNAIQDGIDLSGSATGTVTIAATITGSGGRSVSVAGRTGGTTSFTGAITGKGIELSGNTGATIAFTGQLAITTTTTPAFSATGGGTVTSTSALSTLNATGGGRGVDVVSTTIGGAGLTFKSVSTTGAPSGIRLSGSGAGGLTVLGDGTTTKGGNASGGTIANSTGAGVSLTNASAISLSNVSVTGTPNASGIDGTGVHGFAFNHGTVSNSGGTSHGALDSNIAFNDNGATINNVDGAVTVNNSKLLNGYQFGVDILNNSGSLSNLVLTNNEITSATALADSAGSGIRVQELGSSSTAGNLTKGSISGNAITGFPNGAGVVLQGGNTSPVGSPAGTFGTAGAGNAVVVDGNFIKGHSLVNPMSTNCILVTMPAGGTGFVDITNNGTAANPLAFNVGNCISVNAFGNYTLTSKVTGNVVKPQSQISGASAIAFGTASQIVQGPTTLDSAVLNIIVTGNTTSSTTGSGIRSANLDHGTLRARVNNNNVAAPTGNTSYGIRVDSGNNASSDANVCLEIAQNVSAGSPGFTGIGLRKEGGVATTNDFGIVGLTPSPASAAQMVTYVNGQNPSGGGTTSVAGAANNFVSCSLPF